MSRLSQFTLIGATLLASWLGMQAVHELGHVIGAKLTGGKISRVVLHPLAISRTELSDNPRPLVVVWFGPILGVLLPALIWATSAGWRLPGAYLLRFFTGFCLVANGAYVGAGSLIPAGDSAEMLRHGSPPWLLWLFGAVTVPAGLALWHGQARHFGLGANAREVNPREAVGSLAAFLAIITLGLIIDGG